MIETHFQATCDECTTKGNHAEPVHSSQELGECTKTRFRRLLKESGWKHTKDNRDICPDCATGDVASTEAEK